MKTELSNIWFQVIKVSLLVVFVLFGGISLFAETNQVAQTGRTNTVQQSSATVTNGMNRAASKSKFLSVGSVGLDLKAAPGQSEVRWIDIATGEWAKREKIKGGSVVTITAPAKGHWVAAIVKP